MSVECVRVNARQCEVELKMSELAELRQQIAALNTRLSALEPQPYPSAQPKYQWGSQQPLGAHLSRYQATLAASVVQRASVSLRNLHIGSNLENLAVTMPGSAVPQPITLDELPRAIAAGLTRETMVADDLAVSKRANELSGGRSSCR